MNQTHFSAGRLSIGDYKRPAAKGSGQLPIPFLFCKIDRFCRLLIGVNQLLRCEKKPLISVDCLADDVEAEMRAFYSWICLHRLLEPKLYHQLVMRLHCQQQSLALS